MIKSSTARRAWLSSTALSLAASAALGLTATGAEAQSRLDIRDVQLSPNIAINNGFTPTQARDPVNINGIGQIVTDAGGGSIGLCTGTLINRRTVIFAAHCVNTRAATAYGAGSGGTGIAVGFETNTRANAAGETDELVRWLLGSGANQAGRFQTNTAQALYNINQVTWNQASTAATSCTGPGSCFLEADIALGALDTPANNVPSWTMLFSPLPAPGSINTATGTGYHVTISGYGNNGTGTTGTNSGIDYRRRVAENMLGALTSLNVRNEFLFGTSGVNPQALYFVDFDDPTRTNARDFNLYRDNALPREGITGSGDSGGPLILDQTFAKPTIIGVLSGGTTYFNGQPRGSYGTDSFYQPLFLYWDWIVANNPYRYVTANAGDGAWEDASRWVTELDPAYQIIVGNQLVNGVPTNVGAGRTPVPGFGELCFQLGGSNECQNIATGAIRNNVPNGTAEGEAPAGRLDIEGQEIAALPGEQGIAVVEEDVTLTTGGESAHAVAENGGPDGADVTPHAPVPGYSDTVRPAATLANGLPGATNFVPNNFDGVRTTGVSARYYDVTLRNAGTLTLSSAVTIDRFAVAGANSGLNIGTTGSLTSLSDITQTAGRINVDGTLRTVGDYAVIGGLLSGRGTVATPFLTSVLGTIAPGTLGTIGTLTVSGNVIMSSGSQFAVDVGATSADQLRTTANGTSTGAVNLGGTLNLNMLASPTFGQRFTIVSAAGGVSGQFSAAVDLPGVLRPSLSYTTNSVIVSVSADSYANFVDRNSASQSAVGSLLDLSRNNYATLSGIYNATDVLEGAALGATLESLAPYSAQSSVSLTSVQTESVTSLIGQRLGMDRSGGQVQGLSILGGVQVAALNADLAPIAASVMANAAKQDAAERAYWQGGWKQGVAGFMTLSYSNGQALSLAGTTPVGTAEDDQKSWYIAGGLERTVDDVTFGASVSYSDGDADYAGELSHSDTRQLNLIGYATKTLGQTGYLGGYLGYGKLDIESERNVTLGATTFRAEGETEGEILLGGFEVGDRVAPGNGLTVVPHFGVDIYDGSIDAYRETGSAIAMDIGEIDLRSTQAYIGLRFEGAIGSDTFPIWPSLTIRGVTDVADDTNGFTAAFAGTNVGTARFIGASRDQSWGEVSGSVAMGNDKLSVVLEASSMVERDDIDYQSYRATVSMKF